MIAPSKVCRSVPAVDVASGLSRVRRDAVERGDIGDEAALRAAEGIAGVLDSTERIGPDEMADLFSNLSEAIHATAKAERDALETLRAAVLEARDTAIHAGSRITSTADGAIPGYS